MFNRLLETITEFEIPTNYIFLFAFFAFFSSTLFELLLKPFRKDLKGKCIVISGCDSGFGRALAERLLERGAIVFAGCFQEASLQRRWEDRCIAISLDVTNPESIKKFKSTVQKSLVKFKKPLYALVNNAGIIGGSLFDLTPPETYSRVMDVNFLGVVRLTNAFLSLLKESKGRIVIMSSFSRYACFPQWSAYIASKYAIEGFADCFRREIQIFGIRVVLLQPGLFSTEGLKIGSLIKNNDDVWNALDKSKQLEYGNRWRDWWMRYLISFGNRWISTTDISIVVKAYENALSHPFPRNRYIISPSILLYLQSWVPTYILDVLWYYLQVYLIPPRCLTNANRSGG